MLRDRIGALQSGFLAFVFFATAAHAQPAFGPRTDLAVGSLPREVALADVNRDGHLDLVTACEGESFLGIFLGHGDGTFGPRSEVPTDDGPRALAVADWNGDGLPDLLLNANGVSRIACYFGRGDGTFVPGAAVAIPGTATRLVTADLDGDGILDLVGASDFGTTSLFWIKGAGGGAFGPRVDLATIGGSQSYDVAIGQFDAGTVPDLFLPVLCASCGSRWFRGLGGGTFAPADTVFGLLKPHGALAVDVTHDGLADVVLSEVGSGTGADAGIRILTSTGNGFSTGGLIATGRGASALALGPWGADGESDILVANSTISSVSIARVRCDGVVPSVLQFTVGSQPVDLAIGDVDEDGTADILTANQGAGTVSIVHMLPSAGQYPCGPEAAIPAGAIDFGTQLQGVPTDRYVGVGNAGTTNLQLSSATISGSTEFSILSLSAFPTYVPPGDTIFVFLRYARVTTGTATADLVLTTNDPLRNLVHVPLTGFASTPVPSALVNTPSLDFGTAYVGVPQVLSASLSNVGTSGLTISLYAIEGSDFALVSPFPPASVAVGGTANFGVRYGRTSEGSETGAVHLFTNDPARPEIVISLSGFAGSPPIASFSAPAPPTIAVGANLARQVVLRNVGVGPLHVTIPPSATDLSEIAAFDLGMGALPEIRLDATGAAWDVLGNGAIGRGTAEEYAGGMTLNGFQTQPDCQVGQGGREFRFGPFASGGILLTRKVYVPTDAGWARFVDVAENPNPTARAYAFDGIDNFNFTPFAALRTSSGDNAFTDLDNWLVEPPDDVPGRRALGRVFAGSASPHRPTSVFYATLIGGGFSRVRFNASIPAHGRLALVQWATQGATAGDAQAQVAALSSTPVGGYGGLAAIDRASLWNFPPGPAPFQVVAPGTATIPGGDSLVVDVLFDAVSATQDAEVSGLLRVSTDDPAHLALAIPLQFGIVGGAVVAVGPDLNAPSRGLALAGLEPNPARGGASPRIAYRLGSASSATLAIYDVRGRLLWMRRLERPSPGPGWVSLDRWTMSDPAPGMVWLRLTQGGEVATRKGILLR